MREEILRMERVTLIEQGVTELNHFSLTVNAGEIMGLIPVNGTGLAALMRLLKQNTPIHYGFIYYRDRLVNHYLHSDGDFNRIGLIGSASGLADDLTVADNVFVLRPHFKKRIISRAQLNAQLAPFFAEIGVPIHGDTYARDLSAFDRVVVEIVKAVMADYRLIILSDASAVVSQAELEKLEKILRHYAGKGISFLYISQHYEEIRRICQTAAFMVNGQIAKVLATDVTEPEMIHSLDVENYARMVREQIEKHRPDMDAVPALEISGLCRGAIDGLSVRVAPGECVVIQDLENKIFDDLIAVLAGDARRWTGRIRAGGRDFSPKTLREIAVIQRLAHISMVFPDLSYMDNLCLTMDHRFKKIWLSPKAKSYIRREYAKWLGDDVFDLRVDALSSVQKFDLIYARILLQRPKAVICCQPFMQADVAQRMHIWQLLERLLREDIAVVVLAVNLADTLSLADRLITIQDGRVHEDIPREAFGSLPHNIPWYYLWNAPPLDS